MRDERQKAWKIGREEDKFYSKCWKEILKLYNFTQMLKGNIKALPVIFTFPSRWEMRDKEHEGCEWRDPSMWKHSKT
jgi:hypothetical protein